jgi:hypothetical protein
MARAEDQKVKLNAALESARRRVVEAGHGRNSSLQRRYWVSLAALWGVLLGLLVWFCFSAWPVVPTMLVGAIALTAAGAAATPRIKRLFERRGMDIYEVGPVRLNSIRASGGASGAMTSGRTSRSSSTPRQCRR